MSPLLSASRSFLIRRRKPRDIEHIASLEAEIANLKLYIEGLGLPELAKTNENCGDTDLYHIGSKIRDPSKFVSCDDFGRSDNVTAIEMASSSKAGLSIAAVDEVAALVWKMDIGSAGQPEFTGPSGNFCFPSSQHKPRGSTKTLPLQKGIPSSLSKSLQIDMIDHSLSERLLSYFLNHINPYHHFLEPSTILSAKDYPSGTDALDFLYCAIFAAGACLAIDDYAKQAGDSFAAQADLVALSCCRKNPGTLCVQALTILAWRELSQERDTIAWIYNCKILITFGPCLTPCSNCRRVDIELGSTRHRPARPVRNRSYRHAALQGQQHSDLLVFLFIRSVRSVDLDSRTIS